MRVLVVDDDPSVRAVVAAGLHPTEVIEAADGAQALEMLASSPIDVVLLDVMMPAPDGFAVLARIRARWPHAGPAVLMLTGLTDELDHVAAFRLGADGYITKPVDPEELESEVAAAGQRTPSERRRHREEELARAEFLRSLETGFRDGAAGPAG